MSLQESSYELVSMDQHSSLAAKVQTQTQTEVTPRKSKRVRWESVIFYIILAVLCCWVLYYFFTGVRDRYTKRVCYFGFWIYFALTEAILFMVFIKQNQNQNSVSSYAVKLLMAAASCCMSVLSVLTIMYLAMSSE